MILVGHVCCASRNDLCGVLAARSTSRGWLDFDIRFGSFEQSCDSLTEKRSF